MALHWLGVNAGRGAGGRDGSYSSLLFMIYCPRLNSGEDECCWTPSCFTFTRDFSLQAPAAAARLCDRVLSNIQLALLLI